jgi:hypothetical protein
VLALPLEAESLVDPELSNKRDGSHDDGDAVFVLDDVTCDPSVRAFKDSPKDDNWETALASAYVFGWFGRRTQGPNLSRDVLELADALGNGVGCLLSMRVLCPVVSANCSTAIMDVRELGCACARSPS